MGIFRENCIPEDMADNALAELNAKNGQTKKIERKENGKCKQVPPVCPWIWKLLAAAKYEKS